MARSGKEADGQEKDSNDDIYPLEATDLTIV
jgi:hypothetical protein